jgi:membrane associated rhomboid family serine protease
VIFIPVGHDRGALRRYPVVTFAIIGACVFVALFQWVQRDRELEKRVVAERLAGDALQYYRENADLQPSDELALVFERFLATQLGDVQRLIVREMQARRGPAATRQERQERLDEVTNAWRVASRDNFVGRWGLNPAAFAWQRLFTSMFVHLGLLHLLFNILFLYITGPFIEDLWGRPLFLAFYVLGGAFAAYIFATGNGDLDAPLVGASGAVAAVMAGFLIRYPRAKIRILTFFIRPVIFSAPAWLVFSLWFAGEVVAARAGDSIPAAAGGIRVANWVHVWGFVFGAGVAIAIRATGLESRYFDLAIEKRRSDADDPLHRRLDELVVNDRHAEACQLIADRLLQTPDDAGLADTYWDLARLGSMAAHPAVCLRIIERDLRRKNDVTALERWEELRELIPGLVPDIRFGLLLARCMVEHGRRREADEILSQCCERVDPATPVQSLADLALYCARLDNSIAPQVVRRALAHPSLPTKARSFLSEWQRSVAPRE